MNLFAIFLIFTFNVSKSEGLDNIALNKETKQSSTIGASFKSGKAVDDNLGQNAGDGQCTHTSVKESRFWWTIDLQNTYLIDQVIIYSRTDCCEDRLADFDILLYGSKDATWDNYDTSQGKLCYHQKETAPRILKATCQKDVVGRFLQIMKNKNSRIKDDSLTLCEVQVFGRKVYQEGSTKKCPCSCSFKEKLAFWKQMTIPNRTMEEWREILAPDLEKLDRELRINKTNLSANRRRKNSANDNRKSAKRLGIIGAVFLGFAIGLVILVDVVAIRRGLQTTRMVNNQP